MPGLSGRAAAGPPGRPRRMLAARRAGAWLAWWVILMSLWVILDDSVALDELLAGAGAAALAALLAELAGYQAATRLRPRAGWLVPALSLPGQAARETVTVFGALYRRLARGEEPASGFRELPVRYGDDSIEGRTRRALLVGGRSVAPNTLALGLDAEREVMVIHQLVVRAGQPAADPPRGWPDPAGPQELAP
jgi:multisubunit Na+/H+ antiporter MnhE subunit